METGLIEHPWAEPDFLRKTLPIMVASRKTEVVAKEPIVYNAMGHIIPSVYVAVNFGQRIYENQRDIVDAIVDEEDRRVQIVEPRQSGKSTSAAMAYPMVAEHEAAVWNAANPEPYRIGIFGPKAAQAEIILSRIAAWAKSKPYAYAKWNWNMCRGSRLVHQNGTEIHAISASEQASSEGLSFNRIHMTEAQDISDYAVSNIILPMGSALNAKVIKEGTIRPVRNHFWKSWHEDNNYKKISHHWLYPSALYQGPCLEYGGRRFPKYVLDMMPMEVKEKYIRAGVFPMTPQFHYKGEMILEDFLTQYEIEWLESFGLFMGTAEKDALFAGTHTFMNSMSGLGLELYAGIDFATGSGQDETSVSVFLKTGNLKRKVYGVTWGNLPLPDQKRELINLFGRSGRFSNCRCILGDMGGDGLAVVQDLMAEHSFTNIHAVNFGASDKDVVAASMNLKTSMYRDWKKSCQLREIQYPKLDGMTPVEHRLEISKGIRQWNCIEQEIKEGTVNLKIAAPESEHDDVCSSDVLALRAVKVGSTLLQKGTITGRLGALPHYFVKSSLYH